MSTGSVVCGDVTSSGTVSAPQLFASNTLAVTNTSDFSDDLFLTKNWAGWSKVQISNNSAASNSGPELRLLGNQSARVFLERGAPVQAHHDQRRGAGADEEPLDAAVPHHEPEEPRCLAIAGNTGNVVCNTSFPNLSDSRVKTEMAEADLGSSCSSTPWPHETVYGAPEDVERQPATEFRLLQDNADKFHNKDLTDRRIKAMEDAGAFRAPTGASTPSTGTRSGCRPWTP